MIRLAVAIGLMIGIVSAADETAPPDSWTFAFRDDTQKVWDGLIDRRGKITAKDVITEVRKRGSHHDGDCQIWTGFALLEIEDDPIPVLREMMKGESPEHRAFAALVTGILGDVRLQPELTGLLKDTAKLGEFPGDWFWDTVADAAGTSLRELERGGAAADWISRGGTVAPWLKSQPKKRVEQGDGAN